jgi:hypothetical protein
VARPSLGAGWPLRAVLAGQRLWLVRLAAFVLIASAAISSLVLMFPVSAYYQTVDLTESRFDIEVDGLITDDIASAVDALAEPGSLITFVTLNPALIKAGDRTADHAFVALTRTPDRLDASWFPDTTAVAGADPHTSDWIDLSADAARTLGVGPGDEVRVPILGSTAAFTVRRILATARSGFREVAVGPLSGAAQALLAGAEYGATPTVLLMRTHATPDDVRALLDPIPGGSKLQVMTRSEWLAQSETDPLLSRPVQLSATLLGVACLAALALREGQALVVRRRHVFTILVALGATRRHVIGAALVGEGLAVAAGLAAGWWLTEWVAYRYVFAAALPTAFRQPIVISFVAAWIVYVATVGISASRRLRRHDLYATLTSPA